MVQAIGAKMRPSWRCSVKMGMCAAMMMSIEKKVGRPDLDRRVFNGGAKRLLVAARLQFAEPAEDIFDHDDRAVHDDAKIHRAEGNQVGRNAAPRQADERRQQRQGNDDGDNRRRPEVAEKQQQHKRHQNRAGGEIFKDRVQGRADQPGAVIVRNDFDAFGQNGGVQHFNLGLERLEHHGRIVAFVHVHDAENNVVVLVLSGDALDRQIAEGDIRDVFDQNRRAIVGGDDDVLDFIGGVKHADAANEVLLRTLRDFAAADIGVAAAQRGVKLLQCDAVIAHLGQIGIHLIRFHQPAKRVNVRHARAPRANSGSTTQSSKVRNSRGV